MLLLGACDSGGAQGQFDFTTPAPGPPPGATSTPGGPRLEPAPALESANVPAIGGGCGSGQPAGDLIARLESADDARSYRIHVPANYDKARPTPMVVNFHGSSKTALDQETYSGLGAVADREGFILVTPEGSGWPQGWDVVGVYANAGVDDVVATQAIVDAVKAGFCIDPLRVYATGLSNGAEMASQAGCYLPNTFAAVAPVAGVVYQGCDGRAMPIISFHGTEDYNVPFETAQPAMAEWANHNGCSTDLEIAQVTEHVSRESYAGCGGADVELYVIDGGGHTWPDAEDDAGGAGPTTHEVNASDLIWRFFASHPMRGS